MTDTAAHHSDAVARSVFDGLVPHTPEPIDQHHSHTGRIARGVHATVPILLVGSMAAMTLNLTGPVDAASAKRLPKPKILSAESAKATRQTVAPATAATPSTAEVTAAAPATYRVVAGDTVSDIAGRFGLSTASVLALNGLSWSSMIFPGQELKLSTSGTIAAPEQADATPSGHYTIVAGDTISGIAERFGVSTIAVLTANGLGWSSIIYPGQTLAIPGLVGPGTPAPSADPEPVEPQAPVAEVPVVEPAPVEPAPVVAEPIAEEPAVTTTYTIVAGDTLWSIADRFGISVDDLMAANGLDSSSVIYAGHTLQIPGTMSLASVHGAIEGLDAEMAANAAIIVQVGQELGVPDYGIIIALATAMQESTLRNLDWGDRDSVGLFQQRPSSGWGSVEQLTTPSYAARLFFGGPSNPNRGYTRGLLDIPGWQNMSLTQAAQAVQISAYPDAYAQWEASARAWFSALA